MAKYDEIDKVKANDVAAPDCWSPGFDSNEDNENMTFIITAKNPTADTDPPVAREMLIHSVT